MSRGNLVVAVLLVALTGCTPGAEELVDNDLDQLVTSDVDPLTRPGFASEVQDEHDVLPEGAAVSNGIDLTTTQYQGVWDGLDIYLGVRGASTVSIITISHGAVLGEGSSRGNAVMGFGDPMTLQYLPQGSASPPEGWRAFSDWMIVRDLE